MRNINTSNITGEIIPVIVNASSTSVRASMKIWATIKSLRRSMMSASAPAGSAKRNSGRLVAAATSETINGEESRLVISHAVAMLAIHPPMFVMRTAVQTIRNAGTVSGLQAAANEGPAGELVSATAHLKFPRDLFGPPSAEG